MRKEEIGIIIGWLLIIMILGAGLFLINGCNASNQGGSVQYTIDNNGTIPPLDENQTITPGSNVQTIEVQDDGLLVYCAEGSTCTVTVGTNIGNSTTLTYELFYNGCCYTCGECDKNVTEPPSIDKIPPCNEDFSGDPWCKA